MTHPMTHPMPHTPLTPNRVAITGRLDTMTIKGGSASITMLKDGYDTPTGVTATAGTAWVSEGQLEYLFDPAKHDQKPHVPFRLFAVALPK
jgi:hypothetical protein